MTKPNTSRKSNYAMLKEGHDKEMVEAQKEIDKLKEMLDSTNKVCKDLLEKDTANEGKTSVEGKEITQTTVGKISDMTNITTGTRIEQMPLNPEGR